MKVSVVIPHLNRADLLDKVLCSIHLQQLPVGTQCEVIVVDNASRDSSAEVARFHGANLIQLESNQGVSRALNRGISESSGDLVVILNNDVELTPDWTRIMLESVQKPNIWFATGKLYNASRTHLLDGAGDAVCRGGTAWRVGHGKQDGPEFNFARGTYFPAATATIFRREFFEQAGLFEESFFAYLEDVDLGIRAASLGLQGVYEPEAIAWHRGSETWGHWSNSTVTAITRNQLLLLAKHYSGSMLLRFCIPILTAQKLWLMMVLSHGKIAAWLHGMWSGLREIPRMRRKGSGSRTDRLQNVLIQSEREIAIYQESGGWDRYWKWYFRLAWPKVTRPE